MSEQEVKERGTEHDGRHRDGDALEDTKQMQREERRGSRRGNAMSEDAGKGNANGRNGRAYVRLASQRDVQRWGAIA